jgi:maltose O-acetyltransferase
MREAFAFLRRRGLLPFLASTVAFLRMRWAFRSATSIGSARLTGKAVVRNSGNMVVENRVRLDGTIVALSIACFEGARLRIGEGTFINFGSDISATASVEIGRDCDIGQYAIIIDNDFHRTDDHHARPKGSPVVIEDEVWLGARVTVLPGSHIGRGSVIGAHAVVSGEIPPDSLAVGVPARVVRSLRKDTDG